MQMDIDLNVLIRNLYQGPSFRWQAVKFSFKVF